MIATGNLLARPEDREALLVELLEFSRRKGWRVTFVNVPRTDAKLFRRHGFQLTKLGEEPIVRLQSTSWQGQCYGWVRRQENYCTRQGVEFCEIIPDPSDHVYKDQIVGQLEAVSRASIASTLHQRELPFFEGRFCPLDMRRRRLFVARHSGRIVAFAVCNPGLGGDLWAVEIFRRLPDAVRGVMPFLIMKTLRTMQGEGVRYVSLSLVPFLRCELPTAGDSRILRASAYFWWKHLNAIFDVQGIFHFKSRFRPDYRELYVAALPGLTVRSVMSLAAAWKVFHFNPLRLLRGQLARRRATLPRRTLAVPAWRPERVIRELHPKAALAAGEETSLPTSLASPQPLDE
jgi:phosphatidylglycerol lysyltransferase